MQPMIGEIRMFGGNFAPRSWALCDGQLLPISQNSALFSILGTTYGGDGRTTFALPDLRGRTPIHAGTGPGLSPRRLGQRSGSETNILNTTQLPSHNHTGVMVAAAGNGDQNTADGNALAHAARGNTVPNIYNSNTPSISMHSSSIAIGNTGNNQPINNMMPYNTVNYIIALQGVFPSRN